MNFLRTEEEPDASMTILAVALKGLPSESRPVTPRDVAVLGDELLRGRSRT